MGDVVTISILCFIFGSIVGSFLGVCAFRIPMGKYEPIRREIPQVEIPVSILSPRRSFCPRCMRQLAWHQMIPIVSWFMLRGRCSSCEAKIPFRYCAIELTSAVFAVFCYLRFGLTPTALVAFIVVGALIVITFIDIDYMIIPDVITYPGTIVGIAIGLASSFLPTNTVFPLDPPFVSSVTASLLGIASGSGPLLAIWWFYLVVRKREGLGLGDVKLLALLGALFGYECALITIFIGSVLGSVVGLALIACKRHSVSSYLSFGPYLVVAAIIYIFNFADLIVHINHKSQESIWRVLQ